MMKMNMKELVESVKQAAPDQLSAVPDGQAAALLKEVFRQLTEQIDNTPEGVITVAGLGRFQIRVVHQEKDGEQVTIRRVLFQPAAEGGM